MKFEIGNTLQTHQSFQLDIANVITGRTFIASITRYGKSWTARKTVEECFGHAGIIIIDPEGEYVSLREKYPLLIIGKDIPLQLETAEFMADKILEAKISVIIDLSTTEDELGKEYIDKLLKRFFFIETTTRTPYLVVVEEAEDFIPEKGIATATCLDIFRNIAKKGGKRGIGIMVIAHRPAWVSKGVLSQCGNKAIGRMDWPSDLGVIEEYLRIPRKTIEKLPTLNKGEFFFAGDWVEEPIFVKVGQVKTTHLGYTPNVIPPSPKELQSVIASLQRSLPEVIEKIKPTTVPIDQIKTKLKEELEKKYQDRITGIQRTADEKAERKYKTKIEELQTHIENLSRSQALQSVSPISDALDHPIVKTRMLELPDKARDLLTKVEREPGLTREQLAAFLTTSTNNVAGIVDKINRVFRATAIVGEGKPIRYKSMLKRLFITDVAKREIEELQRLQRQIQERDETIKILEPQVSQLRQKTSEFNAMRIELTENEKKLQKTEGLLSVASTDIDRLNHEKKELIQTNKAGEALYSVINSVVDRRLGDAKPNSAPAISQPQIDMAKIEEMIDQKVKERASLQPASTAIPTGSISTTVELKHKVTHFDFQKQEEHIKANTTDLQGRIIYLITKGFFESRHSIPEVTTELLNNGWSHDKREVSDVMVNLCQLGIVTRKISTGNMFWYSLTPEAKERIHA